MFAGHARGVPTTGWAWSWRGRLTTAYSFCVIALFRTYRYTGWISNFGPRTAAKFAPSFWTQFRRIIDFSVVFCTRFLFPSGTVASPDVTVRRIIPFRLGAIFYHFWSLFCLSRIPLVDVIKRTPAADPHSYLLPSPSPSSPSPSAPSPSPSPPSPSPSPPSPSASASPSPSPPSPSLSPPAFASSV
jgi:hypothetical protein